MDHADIDNRFTFHAPKPGQPEVYQNIRNAAHNLALFINDVAPDSREKSLAITHLEEVVFWTNAAVARHG
jgi:hypothetical protein